MSQNDTLHLAQEFVGRMGSGARPAEIAKLFSENMEWEIAGDTGALPWIGKKSGRAAITDFVNDSRALIERITFEIHDILAGDDRAVILGSLASRLKRTGKIVKADFAIVLTVANGEILGFRNVGRQLRCLPGGARLTRLFGESHVRQSAGWRFGHP